MAGAENEPETDPFVTEIDALWTVCEVLADAIHERWPTAFDGQRSDPEGPGPHPPVRYDPGDSPQSRRAQAFFDDRATYWRLLERKLRALAEDGP